MNLNAETITAVGLAVCCILAVGTASSTLQSSLSTDPDDAVGIDYESLPIGEGPAKALREEIVESEGENAGNGPGTQRRAVGGGEGDESDRGGESGGEPTETVAQVAGGTGQPTQVPDEAEDQAQGPKPRPDDRTTASNSRDGSGPSDPPPSPLERLLDLLRALLPWLVAAAVLALLAHRYRDRIRAWLGALGPGGVSGDDGWEAVEPANEVDGAWLSMVRRVDGDGPRSRTPEEWAAAARAAGMNPDAVATLTAAFEEVRYGGTAVTDDHRRRVREALRRLDEGERGHGGPGSATRRSANRRYGAEGAA